MKKSYRKNYRKEFHKMWLSFSPRQKRNFSEKTGFNRNTLRRLSNPKNPITKGFDEILKKTAYLKNPAKSQYFKEAKYRVINYSKNKSLIPYNIRETKTPRSIIKSEIIFVDNVHYDKKNSSDIKIINDKALDILEKYNNNLKNNLKKYLKKRGYEDYYYYRLKYAEYSEDEDNEFYIESYLPVQLIFDPYECYEDLSKELFDLKKALQKYKKIGLIKSITFSGKYLPVLEKQKKALAELKKKITAEKKFKRKISNIAKKDLKRYYEKKIEEIEEMEE